MPSGMTVKRDIIRDYEEFYARGGWDYGRKPELKFIKQRIVDPLQLAPGSRVLELGCGMGLQSAVWHDLGFDITAIDRSRRGIDHARAEFSQPGSAGSRPQGPDYRCMDVGDIFDAFEAGEFDIVYVRGMSWYHYELNGVNKLGIDVPKFTEKVFGLLKPGGIFILQIKTDFTGRRPDEGVYHCKVDEFRQLFAPLGNIELLTDWHGTHLNSNEDGERSAGRIIIVTRK